MLEELKKSLEPIGYKIKVKEDSSLTIWHECMPWTINLIKEEGFYYPIIYFRTYFGLGERTDLHEIIPMVAMLFFRIAGKFSFRFLGQHNEWSEIEDELYGTFIFPSQPLSERIRISSKDDIEELVGLLLGFVLLQNKGVELFGIVEGEKQDYGWEGEELNNWVTKIKNAIGGDVPCTYNERRNPTWYYFRSFCSGISVVKSEALPRTIKLLSEQYKENHKTLEGVSGRFFISGDIKNCVGNDNIKLAQKIITSLEGSSEILVIPHENIAYILGDEHIVAIVNDGGIDAFLCQKEMVMKRNVVENQILFSDKKPKWSIKTRTESALFEDLTLELLSREPYIVSAKKVAPTNQGDNGRDIICEYNASYKELRVGRQQSSLEIGKLIVQCKTNLECSKKQSIGKSDVDVADTVYGYQPDAYLLVVNTQVTRDLTEYLEKIRARDKLHWVEWWNSFDIEERLRMNPDIMSRYRSIVVYE
ncbi:hypothetical protein [Ectothiorhodospira variabilis]|uniref:hypothetical protein n=1 Tax=Ectothiorhodospira variabilis TaxID=505694 RepID=UPI001EFAF593|nr:hypothetical protein [Ectothiorhodospira variabilis]MCG5496045.1 hypothetical protein [Ectothiorhodospira variabilis]MCG5505406.1 hypothetical protein [Ectothiorhodospira variabilis]MCG5508593.1 hypothetical protein [Ectothiorhodospira variabilis]